MDPDAPRGIADARAREFAAKDKVIQTTLDPVGEVTVNFPVGQVDRIEVITSRDTSLFFAPILGMSRRVITARAVAAASVVGSGVPVNCIKPWAIPYPWVENPEFVDHQGNPNGLYDDGEVISKDCVNGTGLCPGAQLTVKIGTPNDNTSPSGQQSSGQFFIIQGNLGGTNFYSGGAEYRDYIADGCFSIDMNLPVDLMTGDKVGPTRQGVTDLISGDPDAVWDDGLKRPIGGDYENNWEASPRIVRVVIYDPSVPMLGSADGQGTHTYIPEGYSLAGFWLEGMGAQGTVTGRYIPAGAFGSPDETPGPPTGTEVKVIALVE
jgi:hypothetical protein